MGDEARWHVGTNKARKFELSRPKFTGSGLLWRSPVRDFYQLSCYIWGTEETSYSRERITTNRAKTGFPRKERGNGEYLDRCGVKQGSKVKLIDDPDSRFRRTIEMRRNAKIMAARGKIDGVCAEIDTPAEQVSVIKKSIGNGNKVAEVQITTLIEMLMRQAVKLDCISVEGDPFVAQKDLQSRRVQKCVEMPDILKVSNKNIKPVSVRAKWDIFDPPLAQTSTTKWEYFD